MDKERERAILDYVFGGDQFRKVIPGEKPDFECMVSDTYSFGVEVTELFTSESAARSVLLPEYLNEIVHEGKYRHKDDNLKLRVQDGVYTKTDTGKSFPCKVIRQERRTTLEFSDDLTDAIQTKNAKCGEYRIAPTDLIVHEADNPFGHHDFEKMVQYMLASTPRQTVIDSPFREIYLVSNKYQSSELTCFSLRATAFVSEIMTFRALFDEYHRVREGHITVGQYIAALGHHLKNIFPSVAFDFDEREQLQFIWASVSCGYNDDCSLQITDTSLANQQGQLIANEMETSIAEGFNNFLCAEKSHQSLTAFIQFPARSSAI